MTRGYQLLFLVSVISMLFVLGTLIMRGVTDQGMEVLRECGEFTLLMWLMAKVSKHPG